MKELNEEEKKVILNKGTEAPFSGKYNDFYEKGNLSMQTMWSFAL